MLIINCLFLLFVTTQKFSIADEHYDYWTGVGQNILRKQLLIDVGQKHHLKKILPLKAKNVILVIGSGLSMPTIRAADWYQKQKYGSGVYFDNFPIVGFANTFCSRAPVVNGECVGTSFSTKNDAKPNAGIESVAQWALDSGKDVGIVTTSKLTSSAISLMYGSKENLEWESDVDVPKNNNGACQDLACQLLLSDPGKRFKVVLGGGMKNFVTNNTETFNGSHGRRLDGRNIIHDWIDDKKRQNLNYKFVENRKELLQKDKTVDYLLGIFDSDDMEFHLKSDHEEKPSLSEMTITALNILSKNEKGYFLFVYDGTIDAAHKSNRAHLAMEQVAQLSSTAEALDKSTSPDDTLFILTADHGSTMTMSGYPLINDDILKSTTKNGYNFSILTYGNGPGHRETVDGSDIKDDIDFKYLSLAPLDKATRGGESVAVYARGPWQELFTGSYNLDMIPHSIGYAASIGPGKKCCKKQLLRSTVEATSSGSSKIPYRVLIGVLIVIGFLI